MPKIVALLVHRKPFRFEDIRKVPNSMRWFLQSSPCSLLFSLPLELAPQLPHIVRRSFYPHNDEELQ